MYINNIDYYENILKIKNRDTYEHCQRLKILTDRICKKLNIDKNNAEKIKKASVLHDIGKLYISNRILDKKGKLSKREYRIIKKHTIFGYKLINSINNMEDICEGILYHHENWDGTGYPNNLKFDKIPLSARIIRIVDVYDALTNKRSYKNADDKDTALRIIKDGRSKEYDPFLVDIFKNIIH